MPASDRQSTPQSYCICRIEYYARWQFALDIVPDFAGSSMLRYSVNLVHEMEAHPGECCVVYAPPNEGAITRNGDRGNPVCLVTPTVKKISN